MSASHNAPPGGGEPALPTSEVTQQAVCDSALFLQEEGPAPTPGHRLGSQQGWVEAGSPSQPQGASPAP